MQIDLRFQEDAAETAYRRLWLALQRPHGKVLEWMRLVASVCLIARLALLHESLSSIAAALLNTVAAGAQLVPSRRDDLRLHYMVAAACELLMVVGGCLVAPHLGLSGGAGAPVQSVIELVALGGTAWPLFSVALAPLPFRLLYPVLLAQSAVLLLQARRMCASPGLQHGYALLHRGLLRVARRARLLLPDAAAATAAEGLCCATYHPAFIVLGNVLVGYLAFSTELSQRRAFVRRRGEAASGQRALLAALRRRGRLPVQPADYWLHFALPAACALAFLHLRVLALLPAT